MFSASRSYPFEIVLHVLQDKEGNVLTIEDDHHNNYKEIVKGDLKSHTWEGMPIELNTMMARYSHFDKILSKVASHKETPWEAGY